MSSTIKERSSNAYNLKVLAASCEVNQVLTCISQRWKMQILYSISEGIQQFSQLKKAFPSLSDQILSKRLHQLSAVGVIEKTAKPDLVPPQIIYSVNEKGKALLSIVLDLQHWGKKDWVQS